MTRERIACSFAAGMLCAFCCVNSVDSFKSLSSRAWLLLFLASLILFFLWTIWSIDTFVRIAPDKRTRFKFLFAAFLIGIPTVWSYLPRLAPVTKEHTLSIYAGNIGWEKQEGIVVLRQLAISGEPVPAKNIQRVMIPPENVKKKEIEIPAYPAHLRFTFRGNARTEISATFYNGQDAGEATIVIDGMRSVTQDLQRDNTILITPDSGPQEGRIELLWLFINALGMSCILLLAFLIPFRLRTLFIRKTTLVLSSLILTSLVILFCEGRALGIDRRVSTGDLSYNIPTAISRLYYGIPGYGHVCVLRNMVLEIVREQQIPQLDNMSVCIFPEADMGGIDYATLSLALFGLHFESIYYTWFVIFLCSIILFSISFIRRPKMMLLLLFLLISLDAVLFAYPFSQHLGNIADNRAIGLLSSVAFLHLIIITLSNKPLAWQDRVTIIGQAFLVVFMVFCRVSVIYQVIGVGAAFIISGMFRKYPQREPTATADDRRWFSHWAGIRVINNRGFPLLVLVIGLILLQIYKANTFSIQRENEQISQHNLWHNIGIGLGFHPEIARNYDISVEELEADPSMLIAVNRKAKYYDENSHWLEWDKQAYEKVARDIVLEIVRNHPKEIIELVLIYKPGLFLDSIFKTTFLSFENDPFDKSVFDPFRIAYLILIYYGLMAVVYVKISEDMQGIRPTYLLIVWIPFLVSCIPWVLTYPLLHIIIDSITFGTLLIYSISARFLYPILRRTAAAIDNPR